MAQNGKSLGRRYLDIKEAQGGHRAEPSVSKGKSLSSLNYYKMCCVIKRWQNLCQVTATPYLLRTCPTASKRTILVTDFVGLVKLKLSESPTIGKPKSQKALRTFSTNLMRAPNRL